MAKRKGWAVRQQRKPPDGKLRLSQAVSTFGPGALVDLLDDAVLVYGLDFWSFRDGRPRLIQEPRLRDDLAEQIQPFGLRLSQEAPFREPPSLADERDAASDHGIPVLEFPRWFVCQNPRCRSLMQGGSLDRKARSYVHECDDRSEGSFVPVRFVVACRKGHLDEFPWVHFVHPQGERCAAPGLKLEEGRTGDFAELLVACACGARRRLIDASVPAALPPCQGRRPWLGREGDAQCDERLRLLVRTASNGYFPQVVSALSIPEKSFGLREAVQSVWGTLCVADASNLSTFRSIPKVKEALAGYSDEAVLGAIAGVQGGLSPAREPLRTAEFRQIVGAPLERPGELPDGGDFFAREARTEGGLPEGVAKLVLLPKLREVRAQIGFTRIEAASPNLQGEFDLGVQLSPLSLQQDWLPAHEVRGEGLFVQLDEEAVRRWEARPGVIERAKDLLAGYEQWARQTGKPPPFPGARFYLLHSLSHLLLGALSIECGYSASSLRERIYCAPATDPVPMAAILLSTGTPGAEGTLGGIVEQGRRLRHHLGHALELARLCSNDPVCAAHNPHGDLAERHLEGAACHGCLFAAESSCERFNRYLDRALVVPTMACATAAFFG